MSLRLIGWILGAEKPIFKVTVSETDDILNLQDAIKQRFPHHLASKIAASELTLFKAPPMISVSAQPEAIDLKKCSLLLPLTQKVSFFFRDASTDHLHVVVLGLLHIRCFVLGDKPQEVFISALPHTHKLIHLRDSIKAMKAVLLKDVDASSLQLYRAFLTIDDIISNDNRTYVPLLNASASLLDIFSAVPNQELVHVVVKIPSASQHYSPSQDCQYRAPLASTSGLIRDRQDFCDKRQSEAPSYEGDPETFLEKQLDDDTRIPCNRPYLSDQPTTLPVALLHPIFGQFVDDCKDYVPGVADIRLARDLVEAMVDIYLDGNHRDRAKAVRDVFAQHDVFMQPAYDGSCTTDLGLAFEDKFQFCIGDVRNEVGSERAEPFFQSSVSYLEFTRNLAPRYPLSVLPCIIVMIFGPYISFAGAAWTDRPHIQMLSTAIPCHFHNTDINMRSILVRHIGAFRRSIDSLEGYYRQLDTGQAPIVNPTYPYPTSFKSEHESQTSFTYTSRSEKVGPKLYFGKIDKDDTPICVKFVNQYCKEAHEFLASKGFAPKLYAAERLPGGWHMVVMHDLGVDYVNLFDFIQDNYIEHNALLQEDKDALSDKVREHLIQLHQAGFVHGDVRNSNIMVKRSGLDDEIFLLDYDYSGGIEKVRYPFDINTTTVRRPEGVAGNGVIKVDHDLEMLDYIWDI